ncbi:osteoclast-associated immunoglobulin-like receptor [Sarcophilus harrisii]|uniref:osteoclast-associated immunoglobulin-like receptor n=1 Tax=Sarcophilus harrisii TaxID=9305 RepID=UPI001301F4BF|nr:osteoclast-associated immunoglobulin-like receptor [Sarcophilus harrisii]
MMIINSGPGGGNLRLLPQSQTSQALTLGFPFPSPISFLSLPASPPRPTLHAEPGPVVAPGEEVTFRCRSPSSSPNRLVTFLLLKAGTQEPLQKNQETLSETNFTLKSPSAQDSGSYSCVYYYTSHPHVRSEASETLELWVTDSLPKPSLSARPSSKVTPEDNVTLLYQGPSRGLGFALYKDGEELPVSTSEPTQHGAEFPLIHVNINQAGEYRCSYLLGRNSHVLALPSDPLELIIQKEQNESLTRKTKTILITALSCAFILFLLLFLTFGRHCLSQIVISHGDTSRRFPRCLSCTWFVCFSSKSRAPQHETEYARGAKCSSSRTTVPEAEDPEGLTYIQLNPQALKEQQRVPGKMGPDPTMYAALALQ